VRTRKDSVQLGGIGHLINKKIKNYFADSTDAAF